MSVIRSLVVLSILIPIAASFLSAGQAANQQRSEQERLQSLGRYVVARGDVQHTVSALGTIDADEIVDMGFETSGQIGEILVKTGDYVRAGDVIVRLSNETQQIDYEQARLALEKANNSLTDLLGPVDENDIQVAEANVISA